jgi:hypothetical protein
MRKCHLKNQMLLRLVFCFDEFSRLKWCRLPEVKLVFVAASQHPAEQLDMRTPRGKSRLSSYHQGCVFDY